jgi:hypothetical protein
MKTKAKIQVPYFLEIFMGSCGEKSSIALSLKNDPCLGNVLTNYDNQNLIQIQYPSKMSLQAISFST